MLREEDRRRELDKLGVTADDERLLSAVFKKLPLGDARLVPRAELRALLKLRELDSYHENQGARLRVKTTLTEQSLLRLRVQNLSTVEFDQAAFLKALPETRDLWDVQPFDWRKFEFMDLKITEPHGLWYNVKNEKMQRINNKKLGLPDKTQFCSEIERSLAVFSISYPEVATFIRSRLSDDAHPYVLRSFFSAATDYALKTHTNPFDRKRKYNLACGYETTTGLVKIDDVSTGFDFNAQFHDIAGKGAWDRGEEIQRQLNDEITDFVKQHSAMRKQFDTEVEWTTQAPGLLKFARSPWLWGTQSAAGKPIYRPGWISGRKNKYEFAAFISHMDDAELSDWFEKNDKCIAWPFIKEEPGKNRVASNVDVITYIRDAWIAYICPLSVRTVSPMSNTREDVAQFGLMRSAYLDSNIYNIPADASKWDQQQTLQSVVSYYRARASCVATAGLSDWDKSQISKYVYSHEHAVLEPTMAQKVQFSVTSTPVRGSVLSGLYDTALLNTVINASSIALAGKRAGVPIIYSQSMGDDMDIAVHRLDCALRFVASLRTIQNINLSKSLVSNAHSQMLRRDFHANEELGQFGRGWSSVLYRKPISEPESSIETRINTTASSYSTLVRRAGSGAPELPVLAKLRAAEIHSQLSAHGITKQITKSAMGPLAHPEVVGASFSYNESNVVYEPPSDGLEYSSNKQIDASAYRELTETWMPKRVAEVSYTMRSVKRERPKMQKILSSKKPALPGWISGSSSLTTLKRAELNHRLRHDSASSAKYLLAPYVPSTVINRLPLKRIKALFTSGLDTLAAFTSWSAGQLSLVSETLKNNIWALTNYSLTRKDGTLEKSLLVTYGEFISQRYKEAFQSPYTYSV